MVLFLQLFQCPQRIFKASSKYLKPAYNRAESGPFVWGVVLKAERAQTGVRFRLIIPKKEKRTDDLLWIVTGRSALASAVENG